MKMIPRLALAATFLAAPYHMTMTFTDGSVELCGVDTFDYAPPNIAVTVTTCEADRIFANGFE